MTRADSPPNASAMSENPCPPALEAPQAFSDVQDTVLNPKAGQVNFGEIFGNPDIQAYAKTQRERGQSDWGNLCRYRQANGALSSPTRVVFMGDSITENWVKGDPSLFGHGVIGRGISGQTSPQMLLRFFQDVIDLHPKLVHIMAGTNDVAGNTGPTTEKDFQNNLRAMVELAACTPTTMAMPP